MNSQEIGKQAPAFSLKDAHKNVVSLDDLAGRKALIVFIPFAFTGTCQGELCALRDERAALGELDAAVVAITCNTTHSNKRWSEDNDFGFPVLSDHWPHGATAQAYGCFNDQLGCAMRSTYVLDADGIVRDIIATDSLGKAREIDAYKAALAAL